MRFNARRTKTVVCATLGILQIAVPAFSCPTGPLDNVGSTTDQMPVCAQYLTQTGKAAQSCHWAFEFRTQSSVDFAQSLAKSLDQCSIVRPFAQDQLVNHPDSYDLRGWHTQSGTFFLSLKDKGGLNQTLVFLRFEPAR